MEINPDGERFRFLFWKDQVLVEDALFDADDEVGLVDTLLHLVRDKGVPLLDILIMAQQAACSLHVELGGTEEGFHGFVEDMGMLMDQTHGKEWVAQLVGPEVILAKKPQGIQ